MGVHLREMLLFGVRQQAIAAGNNAIYDITNASMLLFKKVC